MSIVQKMIQKLQEANLGIAMGAGNYPDSADAIIGKLDFAGGANIAREDKPRSVLGGGVIGIEIVKATLMGNDYANLEIELKKVQQVLIDNGYTQYGSFEYVGIHENGKLQLALSFKVTAYEFVTGNSVSLSNDLPLMDGEASPGKSNQASRSDHIHPSDSNKADAIHTHTASDVHVDSTQSISGKASTQEQSNIEVIGELNNVNLSQQQTLNQLTAMEQRLNVIESKGMYLHQYVVEPSNWQSTGIKPDLGKWVFEVNLPTSTPIITFKEIYNYFKDRSTTGVQNVQIQLMHLRDTVTSYTNLYIRFTTNYPYPDVLCTFFDGTYFKTTRLSYNTMLDSILLDCYSITTISSLGKTKSDKLEKIPQLDMVANPA
ncbi:MAG: hypothetical protein LBU60_06845 [Clostridiales bacterium]|jgi:hypothetical protein|nr:hypothetical protein [Clostridiales bacterium]